MLRHKRWLRFDPAFAEQLGVPADRWIDAMLVAAHVGLLQLRWDILCPTCRAAASTAQLLSQIHQHTECVACDYEFQSNAANAIELVFQVHPEIRAFDDGQYCVGGPEHSPHVFLRFALSEVSDWSLRCRLARATI